MGHLSVSCGATQLLHQFIDLAQAGRADFRDSLFLEDDPDTVIDMLQ